MTNLIIGLIAIALSILIGVVTMSYLGEESSNKGAKAEFMKYMNESQQIAGAITIYKTDGNFITKEFKLQDLQRDKYLSSIPKGDWRIEPFKVFTPVNINICYETNKELGETYEITDTDIYIDPEYPTKPIPYCSKEGLANATICCYSPEIEAPEASTGT